ncbi:HIRAN domain-containing protein [Echinicola jeungdonensis]|uniref:HIRAN domain-containing protein n=1 Tax=Echinicola jeungdonensis TaxID=709343 RepID=A0ABV5J1V7_9BACT|nr:HIRAN domain-containing protein [Echinicola jeungdonensis]MDN3667744.1 HIRAN domain-containing protein [Echinicola jeungdonensis]MDN3667746.1 HIRAN domain-containing protein [Echinicola jeungdonensis]MDN3671195.1 HIRAN domain-containing protein [Echinicola jeungdonensis]
MKLNRKEFLKSAGLGGISLILPGSSPKAELVTNLIAKPIQIYDNYLLGVQYYSLNKCFGKIRAGDLVILEQFSEHEHDRIAVGVKWENMFLGYLPAYENIVLANLMDAGARLNAMVNAKLSLHQFGIGIWTNLIVPEKEATEKLSNKAADDVDDGYRR